MKTLIVYCHPWEGSLNHAVLEAVEKGIDAAGGSWELCDLEADGFDPVTHAGELALYSEGGYLDPLVGRYQEMIRRADRLVFICPIWWNDVPALLRGWFDKVMLVNFSWDEGPSGLVGTLDHMISRVDVYTTSGEPTENISQALRSSFLDGTIRQLGIRDYEWHNLGGLGATTPASRAAWLEEVEKSQR